MKFTFGDKIRIKSIHNTFYAPAGRNYINKLGMVVTGGLKNGHMCYRIISENVYSSISEYDWHEKDLEFIVPEKLFEIH